MVYNACSPFFYFDHAYRDQAYVVFANDLAGLHDRAARVLRAYCMDVKDVKKKGPIAFDGKPLQLGMLENGLWNTRPGQYDTQGQNIWALVAALQAQRRPRVAGEDRVSLRPARRDVDRRTRGTSTWRRWRTPTIRATA